MLELAQRCLGRFSLATVVVVVAVLGSSQTATAAPPWLAPIDLFPLQQYLPDNPQVVVAPDGTAAVAYTLYDGASTRAYVSLRAPGGGFSVPQPVSGAGENVGSVQVAIDRQGNITLAWLRGGNIQVAYRPAGGSFSVTTLPGADLNYPDLAVGDNGAAAVAFTAGNNGAADRVRVSVRPSGGAAFTPAATASLTPALPATDHIYLGPRVAMDAAGDAVLLWQRRIDSGGGMTRLVVETATRAAGGALSAAESRSFSQTLSGNASFSNIDLVMSAGGRAVAAWGYNGEAAAPNNVATLYYSERTLTGGPNFAGSWATATRLSASGIAASAPKLAVDEVGGIVAAWSSDTTVQSSVRPNVGGSFLASRPLSGPGAATTLATIAATPAGDAVIAWRSSSNGTSVYSARRPRGADGFSDVVEVVHGVSSSPPTAAQPDLYYYSTIQLGLDDQGNGFLAALRDRTDQAFNVTYFNQAIPLDPVAPEITGVTAPTSAVAGTNVAFSASANDRTSAVTYGWDFGDGGTASGASVAHTFAGAGAFTVKLTATDSIGNQSSTTRLVQVTAAPVPPAPAPSPPAPAADVDMDGASPPADCNDNDAKIKPGAKEVLGNAVDENCDGKTDPFPNVSASATLSWSLLPSGRTTIRKLTVGGLKKGDVVTLTCKGKGCRKKATGKVTVKGTTASFTSRVKNMTLSPKATLLVKVSRKDAVSRRITYTMVKKKSPKKSTRCQDPGSTKVKVC